MAAVPFIDAFLQKSAGDVARHEGSCGKYYFSVDVVLELSSEAVLFNEVAIPNEMFLSTKGAVEFTRGAISKRRRGSVSASSTINSGDDGLHEFRKDCAELYCIGGGVECRRDKDGHSGRMSGRGIASIVEDEACGGEDVCDRIQIIGKVVEELL